MCARNYASVSVPSILYHPQFTKQSLCRLKLDFLLACMVSWIYFTAYPTMWGVTGFIMVRA